MTRGSESTPAGSRWGLAGVLVLAALLGCDRLTDSGPVTLVLEGDTIQLERGVRLIDAMVETRPDGTELDPAVLEAAPGDVVRFTAGDNRLHALAFESSLLSDEVRAFLVQTGQLRGPPLVEAGTQWVINLADAPVGDYPFVCSTHGVRGSIVVNPRNNR